LHSPQALNSLQLLRQVAPRIKNDFAGLGIVFYDSLTALPHLPLEVGGDERFELPVSGSDAICEVIVRTARLSSQWHDGFHFIHADSATLTHLCQFIAPPLPDMPATPVRASGARHMTALLASRVAGVAAIGLLTHERDVTVYEGGLCTVRATL
jgi:hypothetical protein